MHGALLVDKPSGPTSHDIVGFTRRLLKTKRVGHTGTLDPLATGLLVMLVGHATRLAQFLVSDEKEYVADIRLGSATPTYDAASLDDAFRLKEGVHLRVEDLKRAFSDFIGTFPQVPPPYSAKKVGGVRAYEMARRNEAIDLKPVEVTVHELELVHMTESLARVRIRCSSGFYVRSLAHDVGQVLGCGAHLEALRRTRAGRFSVQDAATLDTLEAEGARASERLVSMNSLLSDLPMAVLTDEGARRAANGNALAPQHLAQPVPVGAGDRVRILGTDGEVLSVAERRPDGLLHPLLVLR